MYERFDRQAFRDFARRHHPDLGGDPAVFAAGVERFRSARARQIPDDDPRLHGEIVFYRRRRLRRLAGRWLGRLSFDGPLIGRIRQARGSRRQPRVR